MLLVLQNKLIINLLKTMNEPTNNPKVCGTIVAIGTTIKSENPEKTWRKREMMIDTWERYPKRIYLTVWGDLCEQLDRIKQNDFIEANVSIQSKQVNERFYTEVSAWKIEVNYKMNKLIQAIPGA